MRRAVSILVFIVVVGGLLAGGWWYVNENPEWWFWLQGELDTALDELGLRAVEGPGGLVVSGFVEADEASVTTEMGGRIVALYADEGDQVTAGQTLVELDEALLMSQLEMAEAESAVAEATLAQVKAKASKETLDHARATVDQARAAEAAALAAWEDAQAMLENPQELDLAITVARAQVAVLEAQEKQAQALADSAQTRRDLADEIVSMLEGFEPRRVCFSGQCVTVKVPPEVRDDAQYRQAMATYDSWQAWTGVEQAEEARAGAKDYLAQLLQQKANPLMLQAEANAAQAQFEIAGAAVGLAQAHLEGVEMGATPEQIAAAEAQVAIARAAVESLRVQAKKLVLEAPISGLVLERPVHTGEVAAPGAPLFTLADLDSLTLTVYVPEDQLGWVQLQQPVSVTVDAYPDRTFPGRVVLIASEAEFTPRNVQTREERVNMVFAVKVRLPNADHALKPGMPADAVLQGAGE
jgi:HlyD family secretion protein